MIQPSEPAAQIAAAQFANARDDDEGATSMSISSVKLVAAVLREADYQFDSSGTRRHSVLWKTLALDMIQALNSNFRKPCV
jgi:hypothetical protein